MTRKILIVGAGGRESAFALRLVQDAQLYAVVDHENPLILECVKDSGGSYTVGEVKNPQVILEFAKKHAVDYVFVSADDPLANGVIDVLLENNFKAIGGTKAATRIEWDKIYSIQLMKEMCPEFTPFYRAVFDAEEMARAIKEFQSKQMQIVVKPQGLTGGKGVKVMPEHLESYDDCEKYASEILAKNQGVLLVEKLEGVEFTIMGITDGKNLVMSPASYDYPYRFEGDSGPGTGGMGCFTNSEKKLPFMTDKDMDDCKHIMQKIIDRLDADGHFFNGVLNGGFFKTAHGIKFMEFNGRFGDPEGINTMSTLQGSFFELLEGIWNKTLRDDAVFFAKKACVVKYLVAQEYPHPSKTASAFTINEKKIQELGVQVFPSACIKTGLGKYETLKRSRVMAFAATADAISDASALVDQAIDNYVSGSLEFRRDVGNASSLQKLSQMCEQAEN